MSSLFSLRNLAVNKEARLSGRKVFKVALSHTWNNKKIFLVPLITAGIGVAGLATFFISAFFAIDDGSIWASDGAAVASGLLTFLIVFLFGMVFLGSLSEATVLVMANQILAGEEASISQAFGRALKSFGSLVVFSIWNVFVGGIIRMVQRGIFTSFIADMISFAGGLAWAAATYLTLPYVIFESVGPVEATKRGVQTIKEKWGDAAAPAVFASGIVMVMYLVGFGLVLGPPWIGAYAQTWSDYTSFASYAIYATMAGGLFITAAAGMLQSGTMAFVKMAIYRYVNEMRVEGLDTATLHGAMYSRGSANQNGLTGTV